MICNFFYNSVLILLLLLKIEKVNSRKINMIVEYVINNISYTLMFFCNYILIINKTCNKISL